MTSGGSRALARRRFQTGPAGRVLVVKDSLGTPGYPDARPGCTPRHFERRVRKWLKRLEIFFALGKEWQRESLESGLANRKHRQSRWLSKERG